LLVGSYFRGGQGEEFPLNIWSDVVVGIIYMNYASEYIIIIYKDQNNFS